MSLMSLETSSGKNSSSLSTNNKAPVIIEIGQIILDRHLNFRHYLAYLIKIVFKIHASKNDIKPFNKKKHFKEKL